MAALTTMALAGAAVVGTAVAVNAMKPKTPGMTKDTTAEDIARERARAEAEAAQASSSKLAARNRARKASSLLARDGQQILLGQGAGKTTLGQ